MRVLSMILCAALGFGICYLVLRMVLRLAPSFGWVTAGRDFHHTHKAPVPRVGGLGLVAAFLVGGTTVLVIHGELFDQFAQLVMFGGSCLAMFALGFWDDLRPLGAKRKLIGQILIALVPVLSGEGIQTLKNPLTGAVWHLGVWGPVFTVLWLVGLTNLINLIDGVDGLAAGICLMLMMLLAYVGYQAHLLGFLAAGMGGALLAFLCFNFPPARLYMGDGGAYFLGFMIGLITIRHAHKGTVAAALIAPLFVLALPLLDATLTIVRRALKGLPIFRADRRHIHHRLLATGLPQRKVVIGLYLFTLVFLSMAFLAFTSGGKLVPVLAGVAVVLVLCVAGQLSFSREWFAVGRVVGSTLEMRQEIKYALSLCRWLELEAARSASADDLWRDFTFLLRKLGFCHARLASRHGECQWQAQDSPPPEHRLHHETGAGLLELGAVVCPKPKNGDSAATPTIAGPPCISTPKLFETLADLAAETWQKAARQFETTHRAPVRLHYAVTPPRTTVKSSLPA